jgi:hypothetical protein
MGQWCVACAYDRAVIHSLEEARAIAIERGGQCLSRRYLNTRDRMRWRCEAGHRCSVSLDAVLWGNWCQACHFERFKPVQDNLEQAAAARRERCLSAYVDKETPLQWQCAERAYVVRLQVSREQGRWCHLCAVKARSRTIEQMQELAQSRGGQCLSAVYPGAHGKIEWQCAKGHVWHAAVNSVWRGGWCPECAHESRRIARTQGRRGTVCRFSCEPGRRWRAARWLVSDEARAHPAAMRTIRRNTPIGRSRGSHRVGTGMPRYRHPSRPPCLSAPVLRRTQHRTRVATSSAGSESTVFREPTVLVRERFVSIEYLAPGGRPVPLDCQHRRHVTFLLVKLTP